MDHNLQTCAPGFLEKIKELEFYAGKLDAVELEAITRIVKRMAIKEK